MSDDLFASQARRGDGLRMLIMAESLLDTLFTILREWRSFTKPRQRDLLRICNRKYEELDHTHRIFMGFFDDVDELISSALRDGPLLNMNFAVQIAVLDRNRRKGRQERLSSFEQARVYATEDFANKGVSFGMVPKPVMEAVRAVMHSFMRYFGDDLQYEHEAAKLSTSIKEAIWRSERNGSQIDGEYLIHLLQKLSVSRSSMELRWVEFSRDYFRAYATFADHGVFLGDLA
jgi:hypothetical protein